MTHKVVKAEFNLCAIEQALKELDNIIPIGNDSDTVSAHRSFGYIKGVLEALVTISREKK